MPPGRHRPPFQAHSFTRLPHRLTGHPETVSAPNGKAFKPKGPVPLPRLNDDVLRTIFTHVVANGALPLGPCLFVCKNWCDLIYATNTLWSTIIIGEAFYTYFLNCQTRFWKHPADQFIRTCIERSRPAGVRLNWDWEGLTKYGFDKYGSPRGPLIRLLEWVTGAVTFNRDEAFKRCTDFTLTWRQGEPILPSSITGGIGELPGLRTLAIRNYPAGSDPLNRLLRKSHDTLEEISIEDITGMVYWTPVKGDSEPFSSLRHVRMHNTRMWGPADLLVLGTFLFVQHLSLGSGNPALANEEDMWVDAGHYEGKALPAGSISLPHLVSLRVLGVVSDSVLRVLRLLYLEDLYVEQDVRGMTSLPQMTSTRIPRQIKRLRVVASCLFALAGWDRDLKEFLELSGENVESVMVEKWMERRLRKVSGNLTIKRKFRVLVAP